MRKSRCREIREIKTVQNVERILRAKNECLLQVIIKDLAKAIIYINFGKYRVLRLTSHDKQFYCLSCPFGAYLYYEFCQIPCILGPSTKQYGYDLRHSVALRHFDNIRHLGSTN